MKLKNQLIYNSIQNIFKNHNKIFIHPIYLINNPKLYGSIKIMESPNFDNSKLEIIEDTIYIKEHTFTGLRGVLSLDTTSYINQSILKNKILKLLSVFSGRLFELRYIYLYKYLPSPNSYVKTFFNNCCGFNLEKLVTVENNEASIPYRYLLNKNKNLDNLKRVLEIFTKGEIILNKYYCFFLNDHKIVKQNKKLNSIYLGEKIPIVGNLINIYMKNYLALEGLFKKEKDLVYVIDYFTQKYMFQYYIKKEKILLKSYVLSGKIRFI